MRCLICLLTLTTRVPALDNRFQERKVFMLRYAYNKGRNRKGTFLAKR